MDVRDHCFHIVKTVDNVVANKEISLTVKILCVLLVLHQMQVHIKLKVTHVHQIVTAKAMFVLMSFALVVILALVALVNQITHVNLDSSVLITFVLSPALMLVVFVLKQVIAVLHSIALMAFVDALILEVLVLLLLIVVLDILALMVFVKIMVLLVLKITNVPVVFV